ncbi:hypothetical protein CesoFtcFv8_018448 [Champsocephalus esox]|uniref:Uncharacterized protein n=1 Tax=Champsocephalus esox TaxID=159716 RepID=A0AAN8GPM8_9TELE|nr:hypothetical protein CesoFtcFv8_018448 [Champsocephalus esox]
MYMSICGNDGEAERNVSAVRRARGTAGPSLIPGSLFLPLSGRGCDRLGAAEEVNRGAGAGGHSWPHCTRG